MQLITALLSKFGQSEVKVLYQKRFLRQLAQVSSEMRARIEKFAFEDLPNAATIKEIGKVEKMSGYKEFYKVRFGSYRCTTRGSCHSNVDPGFINKNQLFYRHVGNFSKTWGKKLDLSLPLMAQ